MIGVTPADLDLSASANAYRRDTVQVKRGLLAAWSARPGWRYCHLAEPGDGGGIRAARAVARPPRGGRGADPGGAPAGGARGAAAAGQPGRARGRARRD